jgi:hypothetical protein
MKKKKFIWFWVKNIALLVSLSIFFSGKAISDEIRGYMYLYGEVGADYISDVEIPSLNKIRFK